MQQQGWEEAQGSKGRSIAAPGAENPTLVLTNRDTMRQRCLVPALTAAGTSHCPSPGHRKLPITLLKTAALCRATLLLRNSIQALRAGKPKRAKVKSKRDWARSTEAPKHCVVTVAVSLCVSLHPNTAWSHWLSLYVSLQGWSRGFETPVISSSQL